jgi:hypothetical protein
MGNSLYVPKYKTSEYTKIRPSKLEYKIDGDNVFWRGQKIHADGKSFKTLHSGYGIDSDNVFWRGQKLDFSDKEKDSFISFKHGYGKTIQNVYYRGYRIKADPKTFNINEYNEPVDKKYLYKLGKRISK